MSREWFATAERSNLAALRALAWIALKLGRRVARAVLIPVAAYFVLSGASARAASREYLGRVLERPATLRDVFLHFYSFAAVSVDRMFFLSGRWMDFDIQLHGEEQIIEQIDRHGACVLLGAHLGSFECVRTLGRNRNLGIRMVMFERNTPAVAEISRALNPDFEQHVISLGAPGSMLRVIETLDAGNSIGMLADVPLVIMACSRYRFSAVWRLFQPHRLGYLQLLVAR